MAPAWKAGEALNKPFGVRPPISPPSIRTHGGLLLASSEDLEPQTSRDVFPSSQDGVHEEAIAKEALKEDWIPTHTGCAGSNSRGQVKFEGSHVS